MVFISRRCQNVETVHEIFKIQKFPFKNVVLFDRRVRNVPQVSSETSLPCWFKTSQALRSVEKRVEFLERQCHSECSGNWAFFRNFPFPFVSFIGVFSILKCKTLVLKTTTWWTRASHFVDGWHLLNMVSNPFLPSPPKWLTWPLDVCGGVGYGWFYWFSLRIFSQRRH